MVKEYGGIVFSSVHSVQELKLLLGVYFCLLLVQRKE